MDYPYTSGDDSPPQHHPSLAVDWRDPDLRRITRIRLVSDRGYPYWDTSYVYGVLKDGTQVRVHVPFYQLPRKDTIRTMVEYARRDGVYLKSKCGGDISAVISKCW